LVDITKIRYAPEIEVELPAKVDVERLIERGKTLKGWSLKPDGSLTNGVEVCPENSNHLYWNKDDLMQIKEILALLRCHRAKIDPETCGFHIHINIKNLSDKQILTIIKEFVAKQRYIIKRFHVYKKRLDETCKLLDKTKMKHLTEKAIHNYRNKSNYEFKSYSELDEKYMALNISHICKTDYQSIELRLFGGSLNFREIKERIYWALNFYKDAIERE
jgi:hypothetical protein